MVHRKRVDIIASMLSAANPSAKKTRIMYQANLSYTLLTRYLIDVVSASLMGIDEQHYLITEKGRLFLRTYEQYTQMRDLSLSHLQETHKVRKTLNDMCPCQSTNISSNLEK